MLARRWIRASGVRQTLLKYIASAWLLELIADIATGIDKYVSYVTARILVAGDDEVPGVTRIFDSMRGSG
jgi:hypothetical protein